MISLHEVCDQFSEAMVTSGLEPPARIIADGEFHRFRAPGDKGCERSGWYKFRTSPEPRGAYGDWRSSLSCTWHAGNPAADKRSAEDIARWRAQERAEQERAAAKRGRAADRALARWRQAKPADPEHAYLQRKRVGAHGIRQRGDVLLVPLWDVGGVLHGVQEIRPDGRKHFPSGTAKKGHFHVIGDLEGADTAWIAEGYATAASLHVYRGFMRPVVVAFDAGNLEPVARAVTARWPRIRWYIMADDDHANETNVGIEKAKAVVDAGLVAGIGKPGFTAEEKARGFTDLNDLLLARNLL